MSAAAAETSTPPTEIKRGLGLGAARTPLWDDPCATPRLDAQRRRLLADLRASFPLQADADACSVVLLCDDMRVDDKDWAALVVAEKDDRAFYVKPLDMSVALPRTPPRASASCKGAETASEPRPLVTLSVSDYPVCAVEGCCIMDRMRFSSAIRQATVEERPGASAYPAALRRVYHFTREETAAAAAAAAVDEKDETEDEDDDGVVVEEGTFAHHNHRGLYRAPAPSPLRPRRLDVADAPAAAAAAAAAAANAKSGKENVAAAALGDIPEETGERDGHEDDDAAAESGADASTPSSAPSNWAHSMFGSDAGASSGGGGGGGGGGGCRRASPVETLRRALRGAPEGAVLLSLPIADVEMVLNEVEELRRRVA